LPAGDDGAGVDLRHADHLAVARAGFGPGHVRGVGADPEDLDALRSRCGVAVGEQLGEDVEVLLRGAADVGAEERRGDAEGRERLRESASASAR
jgi:hypothetical protein